MKTRIFSLFAAFALLFSVSAVAQTNGDADAPTYYYWYGIQDGTVANPSSPITASNYKTLAESSTTLKESMTIAAKKGYAYVLVPNTVTEVKWFDLNANAYSTMKFDVVDTSIPGHLVYKSENPFSSGNARLDFTYGEVDNNYYYYYGIQDGTLANPSSPINADNYKTLAESSSTLKESMTINVKKGWMYILVPNTVTEIKLFVPAYQGYSSVSFNVVDTSIPGHVVYKSASAVGSGEGRLDFTYGGYIITLDRTSVELTEGETTTLVATVAPDDATIKMVAWSTSDEAIATVDNGVVTAVAAGAATITAKAGDKEATCVVTVEKKEEPLPVVADGEYYLYNVEEKKFLSRGEYWGTCATVDRYGIPFVWTAEEYSLKFLDNNACLFETDDSNLYTDNASTGFVFEYTEGGYLLKSQKSDRYLTIVDGAYTHQIVNVTDDATAATLWQPMTKAEHDAFVAGYVEENYASVIEASGISTTAGEFTDYLAALNAVDKTDSIGTARFAGNAGEWSFTEIRRQDWQPAYGTDFCELWQATGHYTQTITGLAEGIYKVTMQGFERAGGWEICNTLAEQGYEITTATLNANGEEVNLKSWYSGKSGDNTPNNTGEAVAKFDEGKYMNEVYTYVGEDGTLTLTVDKPSHVGDNWVLFNNFTLTRYAEGDATGIDMTTDNRQQTTVIYDLTGRKVENPAKGIYVVNGKKVVLK